MPNLSCWRTNFTKFCSRTWEGFSLITPFSACRHLHPSRRYSRSKCKVVRNRAEFWTFLPSDILGVGAPNVVPKFSYLLHVKSCGKVSWGYSIPLAPKLLAELLYAEFWANFWIFVVTNCWGPPFPLGCRLAYFGHCLTHVKIWGGSTL